MLRSREKGEMPTQASVLGGAATVVLLSLNFLIACDLIERCPIEWA
jgi:hypothetical protein